MVSVGPPLLASGPSSGATFRLSFAAVKWQVLAFSRFPPSEVGSGVVPGPAQWGAAPLATIDCLVGRVPPLSMKMFPPLTGVLWSPATVFPAMVLLVSELEDVPFR